MHWLQARLPDAVPPLPPVAALISLGPLDLFAEWLAHWQPASGTPPVVALGSMSVVAKEHSRNPGERKLAARLRRAEQAVVDRCEQLGLRWVILRPTLLWGAGRDRTVSRLARFAARWHCLPHPRAGGLRQPVHVDDVAAAVLAAVQHEQAQGRIDCGGGERVPVGEMFDRVRRSVTRRSVALPVPALLTRALALGARYNRLAAAAGRLDVDLLADNSRLHALLDVHPRGFSPCAEDWRAR